jgi:hypothetical protein
VGAERILLDFLIVHSDRRPEFSSLKLSDENGLCGTLLTQPDEQQRAAGRCTCGHAISSEVVRESEYLGTLAFFDAEEASGTHGERVERCPNCGKWLRLNLLLQKK